MKSRPGQGLTEISKKIRLKQNDHASRRTQRSPHTRREQHQPKPPTAKPLPRNVQRRAPLNGIRLKFPRPAGSNNDMPNGRLQIEERRGELLLSLAVVGR